VPLNLRMNGCRLRLNLVKLNLGLLETAAERRLNWAGIGRGKISRGINTERQVELVCGPDSSGAFLRQLQLIGHPSRVRQRSRIHLSHDLAAACFYCDLADADVVGDLLVEAAGQHQGHCLAFADREGLKPRA
jgi:hypothetical protein